MRLHTIAAGAVSEAHPNPLLFVHGAWHASWCWEENFIPYFVGKGRSCSAFDLRGHGLSEGTEHINGYGLADYVDDLSEQANALGKPPILIAHSMGGLVAQKYAQDHQVAGVALLAPVPLSGVGFGYGMEHFVPFLKFLLTRNGFAMVKGERLARSLFFGPDLSEDLFQRYYQRLQSESFKALLEVGRGIERKPLHGNPPILILEAGRDAVIPSGRLRETARFYGTAPVRVESIAHDMMIDSGWKETGGLIDDWLGKNGF